MHLLAVEFRHMTNAIEDGSSNGSAGYDHCKGWSHFKALMLEHRWKLNIYESKLLETHNAGPGTYHVPVIVGLRNRRHPSVS